MNEFNSFAVLTRILVQSFRFERDDDRVRFLESVNQYSKLVVDHNSEFPCMKDAKLQELCLIHEGIR